MRPGVDMWAGLLVETVRADLPWRVQLLYREQSIPQFAFY
jgi:hypothetical protein